MERKGPRTTGMQWPMERASSGKKTLASATATTNPLGPEGNLGALPYICSNQSNKV